MPLSVAASSADWMAAGATVATTIILLGSAVFALWQLFANRKTLAAELLTDLSRRWDEPVLRRARVAASTITPWDLARLQRRMWVGRRTDADRALYYRLMPIPMFMEAIAVLVLDVSGVKLATINTLWGGTIIGVWEQWELAILIMRRRSGQSSYVNFETLVERLQHHRAVKAGQVRRTALMAPPRD